MGGEEEQREEKVSEARKGPKLEKKTAVQGVGQWQVPPGQMGTIVQGGPTGVRTTVS